MITREEAKELLPIMQAFVEGKQIQDKIDDLTDWVDTNGIILEFNGKKIQHRIKPEPEYYNYFNVKYSFSEVNREPEAVYFPYTFKGELSGYKVRLIEEKRMWSIGRVNPECELFGWTKAITTGSRKLFITEGEYDALLYIKSSMSLKKEHSGQIDVLL